MNFALDKISEPQVVYVPAQNFMNSIFDNKRIQKTLNQIDSKHRNSHRSFHTSRKNKQNHSQPKQTFRTFTRERRSYIPTIERKKYINLKEQMIKFQEYVEQKSSHLELSKFYQMKEKIMLGFLNNFIDDLSKQNLQKAELLVLIWNNMMLLVQNSLQKICKKNKISENNNLEYQTSIHIKYQNALQECIMKKKQAIEENNKKEKFMKVLVAKIRQYKKQIKKMEDNLRMAASKLNQFRQGYMEIQIQCIDLTMELRNLGEQSAKMMVQKKMALALQKTKEYKILQSKKKRKLQLKKQKIQIKNNENEKIKQQFYDAFKSNIDEKPQALIKIVGRLIEAILDKQQSQPINYAIFNENLVQNKYLENDKADKATDMNGFTIDKADKKVGINPQQRFLTEMTKMRGIQTQTIQKPPPVRSEAFGLQCQFKNLVSHQLQVIKTVDLSFLFQNTIKSSNVKRQNFRFKSFREIPNNDKSKKKIIDTDSIYNNLDFQVKQIESENQNEISSTQRGKQTTNQFSIQQLQKIEPLRNDTSSNVINGNKKIKKLASTFSNKVSFLANMDQRIFKKQLNDNLPQTLQIKQQSQIKKNASQLSDELSSIHQQQHEQTNKLHKKMSNKSLKTSKKIGHESSMYQRQSRFQTKKQNSYIKRDKIKRQKQQKQQKPLNLVTNLVQPIKTQSKNSYTYKHDLLKQIKLDLNYIYEDIKLQIGRTKNLTRTAKNQNKIKDFIKIIQLVIILVIRDYDISLKIKNLLYYVFQVINNSYGITSNSYLRKKLINFISEVFHYKHQSIIFSLFLAMIGLDEKGYRLHQYSNQNNSILIRIMKKICVNFKVPFKLEDLRVNMENLWGNLNEQLIEIGFFGSTIFQIMQKIQKINLAYIGNKGQQLFYILYSVCQHIVQQQSTLVNSYEPIINLVANINEPLQKQLMEFILQLHFLPQDIKKKVFDALNKLYSQKPNQDIDRAEFAYFLYQYHLLDFSRMYYRALNLFQVKQNGDICNSITITKLKDITISNFPKKIMQKIYFECEHISQSNALFHALIKKNLLILIFLKAQEQRCENVLKSLIGSLYYYT